jgi:hypothetical protein
LGSFARIVLALSAIRGTEAYKKQCADYAQYGDAVTSDFWKAIAAVGVAAAVTIAAAFAFGKIGLALPVDPGKVCSYVGATLAALGGWFALAEGYRSYDGVRPDEIARNTIFVLLFWPGVALSLFGALWWQ